MKRSYKQNCTLANALDLVGERWTLLIVRELLTGPKRYGEFAVHLPAMGTNLLAIRLKEMRESDLISKSGSHYQLTEKGQLLEPVVHALVRFGLAMDIPLVEDYSHHSEWDAVALKALYQPDRDKGLRGRYRFELDGIAFCVEKAPDVITISQGEVADPVAGIALDKSTGADLAAGRLTLQAAEKTGGLVRHGDSVQAQWLMEAFGLV